MKDKKDKRERSKGVAFLPLIFFALAVTLCIGTASAATTVEISPSTQTVDPGQIFSVYINVTPDQPIKAVQADLSFNSSLVTVNSVTNGGMFPTAFGYSSIDNVAGKVTGIYGALTGGANTSTPGTLAVISLTADAINGTSELDLSDVIVAGPGGEVSSTVTNGTVTVGVITGNTIVEISPSTQTVDLGQSPVIVNINVTPGQPIKAIQVDLSFNSSLVTVDSVTNGGMFPTAFGYSSIDNAAGKVTGIYGALTGGANTSTPGTFAVISLTADSTNSGTSELDLSEVIVVGSVVPSTVINGTVTVGAGAPPPPPPSQITLYEGWNLVSVPKKLDDTGGNDTAGVVFGLVTGERVWYYNATAGTWEPLTDIFNYEIEPCKGYWVKKIADETINLTYKDMTGPIIPPSISLEEGWNMIGHTCEDSLLVSQSLVSIDGKYSVVLSYNTTGDQWYYYIAGCPEISTFTYMESCKGYWGSMRESATYTAVSV